MKAEFKNGKLILSDFTPEEAKLFEQSSKLIRCGTGYLVEDDRPEAKVLTDLVYELKA